MSSLDYLTFPEDISLPYTAVEQVECLKSRGHGLGDVLGNLEAADGTALAHTFALTGAVLSQDDGELTVTALQSMRSLLATPLPPAAEDGPDSQRLLLLHALRLESLAVSQAGEHISEVTPAVFAAVLGLTLDPWQPLAAAAASLAQQLSNDVFAMVRYRIPPLVSKLPPGHAELTTFTGLASARVISLAEKLAAAEPRIDSEVAPGAVVVQTATAARAVSALGPVLMGLGAAVGAHPLAFAELPRRTAETVIPALTSALLPLGRHSWHVSVRFSALTVLVSLVAASQAVRENGPNIGPVELTGARALSAMDVGLGHEILPLIVRLFPPAPEDAVPIDAGEAANEDEEEVTFDRHQDNSASFFNIVDQWRAGDELEPGVSAIEAAAASAGQGALAAARPLSSISGALNPPLILARLLESNPSLAAQLVSLRSRAVFQLSALAARTASFPWSHGSFRCLGFCSVEGQHSGEPSADIVPVLMPAVLAALASPYVAVRVSATDSLRRITRTTHALCAIRDGAELARLLCGDAAYWEALREFTAPPRVDELVTASTVESISNVERSATNKHVFVVDAAEPASDSVACTLPPGAALISAPLTHATSSTGGDTVLFDPRAPLPLIFAETTVECMAATGVICNLVLFQSPVKQHIVPLVLDTSLPVLARLAQFATSPTEPPSLVANAVWALRNLVFQASRNLRAAVATALGPEGLRFSLMHKNESVSVLGAALLRNLVWHVGTEEDMMEGLHEAVQQTIPAATELLVNMVRDARARQRLPDGDTTTPVTFRPSECDALIHLIGIAHNLYSFPPEVVNVESVCSAADIAQPFASIILSAHESIACAAIRATWNIYRNARDVIAPAVEAVGKARSSRIVGIANTARELANRFMLAPDNSRTGLLGAFGH